MSGHVITANLSKDTREVSGVIPGTLVFGVEGATFFPSVSEEDGTLSWENNRGFANPVPVNIRGPIGPQGETGPVGPQGIQGEQGPKGDKGDRGEAGPQGIQGEKGEKGEQGDVGPVGPVGPQGETGATGDRGPQGEQGSQGIPGPQGPRGEAGYDPVRGVDYWTDADKGTIVDEVLTAQQVHGLITGTASGSPISLTDATNLKLRGLKLFGKTTQNGTPTPDAPVPLVSAGDGGSLGVTVAGKNLYDISKYPLTQGCWITANGTVSYDPVNACTESYIPVTHLKGNTFTLNKAPGGYGPSVAFYDANQGFLSAHKNNNVPEGTPLTFNVPENAVYMRFCTIANDENIQIEIGSTATEYEPYTEQTLTLSTPNGLPGIPVTSGGNYTDETGQQWICDEVDFARGVYVQRVLETDLDGSSDEIWTVNGTNTTGFYRMETRKYEGVIVGRSETTVLPDCLCSHYVKQVTGGSGTYGRHVGVSISADGRVQFYDDRFNDSDLYKEYLAENPVTCLFKLVTPIETPLSAEELAAYAALHTNYPNTTILNDGGAGMEVQYVADTKLYIDNKINAMAAAIVNA